MREARSAAGNGRGIVARLITLAWSGSMSLTRRLSILGLSLLLLVGVSCTSGDAALTEAPVTSSDQPTPEFGLIGDLTDGLTSTVNDLTTTVTGTISTATDLLFCTPQPYVVDTEVIGPAGGVLNVGSHRLVIPSGALSSPVKITGEQVKGQTNTVRFSPEGLRFDRPAVLTMTYSNCSLVLLQKKIVYTTENLKILEVLNSLDLFRNKSVSAPIDHFSRYAVAF
jgi:hypothetical protein